MSAYEVVPLRAFSDNYIWTIRDRQHAAVVDPGDAAPVLDYLKREKLRLVAILNTHHHADHVGGNSALLAHADVPVYGPVDPRIHEVSQPLSDGDRIRLPHFDIEFDVIEIPAHTRTHIAFHGSGMLFCGDTLFAVGCGRLFEGTPQQMHDSLGKLMRLDGDTRVYCGHEYTASNIRFARAAEPSNRALQDLEVVVRRLRESDRPTLPSTIAREKATNPFVRCSEPAVVESASRHAGKPLGDPVSVLAALREWKNKF
ncbi:MAG TPA: hydroxyacylglutathione hydrolase [Burkholderiales bacterium]|nr:hydroxyacylglutathione hydrolase [Burkholderiales bacterium]